MVEKAPEEEGLLKYLDNFWFGHGSPTALGVFRIVLGTLSFINFLMISLNWDIWFTERGYMPNWLSATFAGGGSPIWYGSSVEIPKINILNNTTNIYISLAVYVLIVFFSLTTALGLWTRVSTICLAIGVVSLSHRNELILHGGDTVLRLMILYLALAPCGRACSIDRLIRIWKGKEQASEPVLVSLWPQRLIQFNMALLYFTTVWLKAGYGDRWRNGTATWFPVRIAEFYRFPVPSFVNDVPFVYFNTYATLLIEFALATLVFYRPFRKYVLLSGLFLHGFIEYSMNIPLFGYLMVSMYICFFEGEEITAWARKLGGRLARYKKEIPLPLGYGFTVSGAGFFQAVDPFGFLHYVSGSDEKLTTHQVRSSFTRSVGGWVFGLAPGVWSRLMNAALEPRTTEEEPEPTPSKRKKAVKA